MKPLLIVPIIGPTKEDVKIQCQLADENNLPIEVRLDLIKEDISDLDINPYILTCGQQIEKIDLMKSCFYDVDYSNFELLDNPNNKSIIASYHNFDETPDDLEALFNYIKHKAPNAYLYKIATYAKTTVDSMRMLLFVKKMHAEGQRLLGLCMGPMGSFTRILSPIVQNPFTFAPIDKKFSNAEGQLTVSELRAIYNFDKIGPHTKIYALIGDPVDKSLGHIIHNQLFKKKECNAVYVKLCVSKDDIEPFLALAKEMQIQGMAVTMPLKEVVTLYVDKVCQEPTINTLILKHDQYKGYNLDVLAAYELINKKLSVKDKSIYIIGSGGVGSALAWFLKNQGAKVTLFNRSLSKGMKAAENAQVNFLPLEDFDGDCSILIQATSVGMSPFVDESIIDKTLINKKTLVVDFVSNPEETKFLKEAKECGCDTISGIEIFELITHLHQKIWNISSHSCCHC
jgi:3-dehydroquinate dehydratase/shikimate dehydrogenase